MEVRGVEILLIYIITFILLIDFLFLFEGLLIPIALAVIFVYFLSYHISFYYYLTVLFPVILFLLYFYKFSRFARKLKRSTNGYIDIRIFRIPITKLVELFMKLLDKLQPTKKIYYRLTGQYGYVIKKFDEEQYIIRFNIGAFGRSKFRCYSDEALERGNKVQVKALKDGKIYVEKVS